MQILTRKRSQGPSLALLAGSHIIDAQSNTGAEKSMQRIGGRDDGKVESCVCVCVKCVYAYQAGVVAKCVRVVCVPLVMLNMLISCCSEKGSSAIG